MATGPRREGRRKAERSAVETGGAERREGGCRGGEAQGGERHLSSTPVLEEELEIARSDVREYRTPTNPSRRKDMLGLNHAGFLSGAMVTPRHP